MLGIEIPPDLRPALVTKYGVNRQDGQLFRMVGTVPYPLVFNTSRPLFRGNVALRKAVTIDPREGERVPSTKGAL